MKQIQYRAKKKATKELVFIPDKSPPQAVDLEEAILGSIMLEDKAEHVKIVLSKIRSYHFYKETHQKVFKAISTLFEHDFPIDLLTVTEQCRKNGDLDFIGGPYAITMLTFRISSTVNIDFWFRIVYQKFLQREIIRIAMQKADIALNDSSDVFDLLDDFISELEKLDQMLIQTIVTTSDRLAIEMIEELELVQLHKSDGFTLPVMVYNLGWPRFDEVVSLGKDKIILIAGAASAGKSRFIRTIIYRLLERYNDISEIGRAHV